MAEEQTSQKSSGEKPQRSFADKAFDVAGACLTVGAGLIAAWNASMRHLYNRILGKFNPLATVESEFAQKKKRLGVMDNDGHKLKTSLSPEEFLSGAKKLQSDYYTKKEAALKSMGLDSYWKKLRMLDRYAITETVVEFAGVTALAIGAVMALRGIRNLSAQQDELEERLNAVEKGNQR